MKSGNICGFVLDTLFLAVQDPCGMQPRVKGLETDSVTFYNTLPVPKNPATRVNFYSPRLEVGRSLAEGAQRALHPIGS